MAIIHHPGILQELRRRVPVVVFILAVAILAPLEWFPRFQGRYELGIALLLVVVGMDTISTSLNLLGLVATLRSQGGQSATIPKLVAAFMMSVAFLGITGPILLLIGTPIFPWIATLMTVLLMLCSVGNRLAARRILGVARSAGS